MSARRKNGRRRAPGVAPWPPEVDPRDRERCLRGGAIVARCSVSGEPFQVPQSCMTARCPACSPAVKAKRGRRIHESTGAAGYVAVVLTVPPRVRGRLWGDEAAAFRRSAGHVLVRWGARWWGGAAVGVLAHLHPSGDRCEGCGAPAGGAEAARWGECPTCGAPPRWLPHVDALVPRLGLLGGSVVGLSVPLPRVALWDLRERWGRALVGLGLAERVGRPVVHVSLREPGSQAAHRAAYSARPFAAWSWGVWAVETSPGALATARARARGLGLALRPQRYGLAAPGSRAPGIEAWRAAVRVEADDGDGLLCPCHREPAEVLGYEAGWSPPADSEVWDEDDEASVWPPR